MTTHIEEHTTGVSVGYCDYIITQQLNDLQPDSIVDFGAGNGKNGMIVRNMGLHCTELIAIEGFEETATKLRAEDIYTSVEPVMIQDWLQKDTKCYDVALFGDVLEHLTSKEIHETIQQCTARFKHIIIICPLHDIFQEEMGGNPLEVHKTYVTRNFFDRYNIVEKHIIKGGYTIMNVLIKKDNIVQKSIIRIASSLFHYSILFFQSFGKGLEFVKFVKYFTKRYQWLFNKARKEVVKDLNN